MSPAPDDGLLGAHLRSWVGAWPPPSSGADVHVVASAAAAAPGWDGVVHPARGVVRDDGRGVLGLPPGVASAVRGGDLDAVMAAVPPALGLAGSVYVGSFRWTTTPATRTELPDAGTWLAVEDPRVPPWLQPFGGNVLVALVDDVYVAGVGLKRHDEHGRELSVVTTEQARGRGLGRRLVAQAARRVLDEGRVPTYLHAPDNHASARVAQAAGFTDRGWRVLGFFPTPP